MNDTCQRHDRVHGVEIFWAKHPVENGERAGIQVLGLPVPILMAARREERNSQSGHESESARSSAGSSEIQRMTLIRGETAPGCGEAMPGWKPTRQRLLSLRRLHEGAKDSKVTSRERSRVSGKERREERYKERDASHDP